MISERNLLPSDHSNVTPIQSVPADLCAAFCLFNGHLNLTGTASGGGVSLGLPYTINCKCVQQLTKWTLRHSQCSVASQLVAPLTLSHGDSTPSSLPTTHFCAYRSHRYFGSYCVFRTHPFYFVCIPLCFRPKCLPVWSRAFFQLLRATSERTVLPLTLNY